MDFVFLSTLYRIYFRGADQAPSRPSCLSPPEMPLFRRSISAASHDSLRITLYASDVVFGYRRDSRCPGVTARLMIDGKESHNDIAFR